MTTPLDQAIGEVLAQPPGPDPLDAAINSVLDDVRAEDAAKDEQIRTLFEAGLQQAPDQRAGILEVSRRTGLKPDLVESQFPLLRQRAEAAQFDPRRFREENPGLEDLLLGNPPAASVVMRDEKVSAFTRVIRRAFSGPDLPAYLGEEGMRTWQAERRGEVPAGSYEALKAKGEAEFEARRTEEARPRSVPTIESPLAQETGLGRLAIFPDKWSLSRKQSDLASLGSRLLFAEVHGDDTFAIEKRIVDLQNEVGPQRFYRQGPVEQVLLDATEAVSSQVDVLKGGGVGGTVGAGFLGGVVGGVTKNPQAARGAAQLGWKLGSRAGAFLVSFDKEMGSSYLEIRDLTTDDGTPVDRDLARGMAVVAGLTKAGVEVVALGPLMRSFGPLGEAMAKGEAKVFFRQMLADRSMRTLLRNAGKAWAKAAGAEGAEGGVQAALDFFAGHATKRLTAGKPQELDVDELTERVVEATYKEGLGGATLGGAGAVVNVATHAARIGASERAGAQIHAITGLADSPSVKASPELVAKMVERETAATGDPVTHAYVDAAAFTRLFQEQNADPEAAARELLGEEGPEKLRQAQAGALGGRLQIPMAEYLEKWGPKGVAEALAPDTTVRPGLLTPRELIAHQDEIRTRAAELKKEYLAEGAKEPESSAEIRLVDMVQQQLAKTGAYKAADARETVALTRAFLRTQAEVAGVEPDALFDDYVISVARGLSSAPRPADVQAAQADIPGLEALAPETKAFIRQAIGIEVSGPRAELARKAFLDTLTPAGSRVALDDFLSRPRKGAFVFLDLIEFGKVNKVFGDPVGDQAITTAGTTLSESSRAAGGKLFRKGGDEFVAHFDTLEQARAFLADATRRFEGLAPIAAERRLSFSAGVGKALAEADAAQRQAKAQSKGLGEGVLTFGGGFSVVDETGIEPEPVHVAQQVAQRFEQGERGYVDMLREGLKRVFRITLTEKADLSTFLHESAHVFLELTADLAAREDAPSRLRQDWQATLDWLGVKDRASITRDHHERWARAFESYLREGKAPSLALARAFQRFKLWLGSVYRQLPPEQIDDRIRGVFDRLLATDAEIERMKSAMGAEKPIFRSPDEAGMSPERFQAYLDDREEAFARANLVLRTRLLEEQQRATESWWKEEVRKLQGEADLDYDQLPESRAWAFLKRGETGGDVALEALLAEAREAQAGKVKPKVSTAQQERLDAIAGEIEELQRRRRLAEVSDRLVAEGMSVADAEVAARRQLASEAESLLRIPSTTRKVYFLAEAAEAGPVLAAPFEGEVGEGQELRSLELPSWLSAEEYLSNPTAWRFAWAALSRTGAKLQGAKAQRLVASREVSSSGLFASEAAQRLIAGYFQRAFEAFPVDVPTKLRGWALGRLLSGSFVKEGMGGFQRDLREQVDAWLRTSPERRRFDEPLSDKQWEILLRNRDTLLRRDAEEAGSGDPTGEIATRDQAVPQAGPRPSALSADVAGEIRALEAERERITEEALGAATVRVRVKLDLEGLVRLVGKEVAKERFRGLAAPEGGLAPEILAQIVLGREDGAALVKAMLEAPDRAEWTAQRAEERMGLRHPDLLEERSRLAELAASALHAEGSADWLLQEAVALRSRAQQGVGTAGRQVPIEAIRDAARQIAEERTARDVNSYRALQAERSAAERAIRAAAKGDFTLAYVEQQKRLLNHYLYRELEFAREDRDRFEERASKLADRKRREILGKGGRVFLDAVDSILEALGLKDRASDAELAERQTLPEWVAALDKAGIVPGFAAARISEIVTRPPADWKDLSIADVRMLGNALSQLYTAARDANRVLLEGRRIGIAALASTIATEASRLPKKSPRPGSDTAAPGGYWAKQRVSGFFAGLVDPEQILRNLGPTAERFFWRGYTERRTIEDDLTRKVSKFFAEKWDALPKALREKRYELIDPELLELVPFAEDLNRDGSSRDRQWAWMVALNMGNRSNMDRLLGGYEWNEANVRRFLDELLTDEEWTFIESVWDLLDRELYPEVAAAYEAVNGIKPEKIEALPFTLASGRVIRGGYFPARYDPVASRVGQDQSIEALTKLYSEKAGAYSVSKSFTKGRVERYEDVINLQWSFVPSHVASVIHYVAFDQFVRDAARVLNHPETLRTVEQRLGPKYRPQLEGWLRTVAVAQSDAIPEQLHDLYQPFVEARSRFVVQTLGYSLSIAAGDLTNPLVAIASGKVKGRYMAPALLEGLYRYPSLRRDALQASPELRHRSENLRHLLRRQLAELGREGRRGPVSRVLEATRETAWVFMEWTDRITSTVIWDGAFRQAQAKGLSRADAIAEADSAVRAMLPSHDAAEQPAFLRDKRGLGSLVAFYSYFSKLYNVQREIWHEPLVAWEKAEGFGEGLSVVPTAAHAAGRALAVFFVANVLSEFITGRGPEEDEEWPEWMTRKLLASPFNLIPLVGALAEDQAGRLTTYLWHGEAKHRQFSMRASPAAAGLERLYLAITRILDEDRDTDDRLWALLEAFGFAFKTPLGSRQVARTGRYATSGELGRDIEDGALGEVLSGLVYGDRPRQPLNPFTTDLEDLGP